MAANYTPQELLDDAACFNCVAQDPNTYQLLVLALLSKTLLALDAGADVTPQALLNDAACYRCYLAQYQELELALLDQIAENTAP